MKALLEALGFPTKLPTGHDLGCMCEECHAYRRTRAEEIRERIRTGKEPQSLMEILVMRKRVGTAIEQGLRALHGGGDEQGLRAPGADELREGRR